MAIVFNGRAFANQIEIELKKILSDFDRQLKVQTFTFTEDEASAIYTRLKKAAAGRVGIIYEPTVLSLTDDLNVILAKIKAANKDSSVHGVMIQKPTKEAFNFKIPNTNFQDWWNQLASAIDPKKDVDCLNPENLNKLETGEFEVMPATVRAILTILEQAKSELNITNVAWRRLAVAIIGRSDIVGKPLAILLNNQHVRVESFGKNTMPSSLHDFEIIISAVGKPGLITSKLVKDGCILIDVGSPQADMAYDELASKAAFITPVPGGVGPMTVVSLMENVVELSLSGE